MFAKLPDRFFCFADCLSAVRPLGGWLLQDWVVGHLLH